MKALDQPLFGVVHIFVGCIRCHETDADLQEHTDIGIDHIIRRCFKKLFQIFLKNISSLVLEEIYDLEAVVACKCFRILALNKGEGRFEFACQLAE